MRYIFSILDLVIVTMMVALVTLVFANVVLRYAFNTGLDFAEELPRFIAVWITFLGAAAAYREGRHMGMNSIVLIMNAALRRVAMALTDAVVVGCCGLILWGGIAQWSVNSSTLSSVLNLPLAVVHLSALIAAVLIGFMGLSRLVRNLFGALTPTDIGQFIGAPADSLE